MSHLSKRVIVGVCSLGLVMALAASATAAPNRPWGNGMDSGTGDYFTWSGGGDDNGLFGDPQMFGGDTFVFFPTAFRAESDGAGQVTASDRIEVQIFAKSGFNLTQVVITEIGDYGITDGDGSVDMAAQLSLTEIGGAARQTSMLLSPNVAFPVTSGSGGWQADADMDLSLAIPPWTAFTLEITDDLIAIAGAGTTAFIEKTVAGAAIGVTIVPEPATAALFAVGIAALVARRRGR